MQDPEASGDLNDEDDADHDPMPDESDTSNRSEYAVINFVTDI